MGTKKRTIRNPGVSHSARHLSVYTEKSKLRLPNPEHHDLLSFVINSGSNCNRRATSQAEFVLSAR